MAGNKQKSYKGKKQYKIYQTENRVFKNKIKKLEKHCKNYPEDKLARENLERIRKKGYKVKSKPINPGSNKTIPPVKLPPFKGLKTAGEQLSELLGIPFNKYKSKISKKPKITQKKNRNVKT